MDHALTTYEILRAGWPIVLGLVASVAWLTGVAIMARNTRDEFLQFRTGQYKEDQREVKDTIDQLKAHQEKVEERLETKLDRIAEKLDSQLTKVYDEINRTSNFLSEIKGRLGSISLTNKDQN